MHVERLKSQFLEEEKIVDLVVGPDAYKDLPNLLNYEVEEGRDAIKCVYRGETVAIFRLCSNE
jgi:tRNA-2-methylthio-N6-dimethylallyladenosine synthase